MVASIPAVLQQQYRRVKLLAIPKRTSAGAFVGAMLQVGASAGGSREVASAAAAAVAWN